MNLNEALTVLKENNYLVEFLQDTKVINPEKTINRISKELNINFKKLDNDNKFLCTDIDYTELTNQQIKKIQNIARIFNMRVLIFKNKDWRPHASIKYGFEIMLSSVSTNNPELIHKPYTNSTLYIHGSSIGPEIIMRTGLRPQGTDKIINRGNYMNFGWGGVEKHGEKRIYLSSIGKWEEVNNNTTTEQLANIIINNMNNGYNKYCYLIKLPNNKGIRHDPEAGYDMDWVYTLNKIPPKYILYLGIEGIDFTTDEVYEKELAVSKQDIIDFITK